MGEMSSFVEKVRFSVVKGIISFSLSNINLLKTPEKIYDILLVENDEVDVMSIQRAFRKHAIPHQLTVANNGREALRKLEELSAAPVQWKPHFIILDINMPEMNGLDLLKYIRGIKEFAEVPVFILTTSDDPGDKEFAYRHHISGYIVKPLNSIEFENAILQLNQYWKLNEFP